MTIGEIIRHFREMRKLSQYDLADRCGMSRESIYNYERGYYFPSLMSATTIAEALEIPLDELVGRCSKVCSIGDEIYLLMPDEDEPGGVSVEVNRVTEVGEKHIFFSAFNPPEQDMGACIPISELGKSVFFAREQLDRVLDAKKLKGGAE